MPKTLQQAIQYFTDEQVCIDAVASMRWANGPECPYCQTKEPYYLASQKRWKCRSCRKQFSVKVGTIFEDSAIPLNKWLPALWMLVNDKNGVSSYELHRALGISQKSAWFVLHRLRTVLKHDTSFKLGGPDSGPIEVDEAYIGGVAKNMHAAKRRALGGGVKAQYKTPVMGMLDRNNRQVRAKVVPNVRRETLQNEILNQIEHKSTVYTDGSPAYDLLAAKEYIHETVTHIEEYVRGEVHTQGIENFWSLLKRGLKGTYVAVEPYHLERYVAEQVYRFNMRATKDNPLNDADRFLTALSMVAGKRLTFKELTGKSGSQEAF